MRLLLRISVFLIALFSILFSPFEASAQSTGTADNSAVSEDTAIDTLPEPLSQDAIREMVARMSDDQVRDMLLDRLDAVAAQQTNANADVSGGFLQTLNRLWTAFYSNPLDALKKLPSLFQKQGEAIGDFLQNQGGMAGVLLMLGLTAIAIAVGFAVEYLSQFLIKRRGKYVLPPENASLGDSLQFLFRRFMREIFGLIVFYFTIRTIGRALLDDQQLVFIAPLVTCLVWWASPHGCGISPDPCPQTTGLAPCHPR